MIERDKDDKKIVLTVKPSTVMPHMTMSTDEVEKALYLGFKYGIPPSFLTNVFDRNDSY